MPPAALSAFGATLALQVRGAISHVSALATRAGDRKNQARERGQNIENWEVSPRKDGELLNSEFVVGQS